MLKKILIIMNCAGDEIHRYLSSSLSVSSTYRIDVFRTYTASDETREVLENKVRQADVIIAQNVQSISWLQNSNLRDCMKKGARFIELAFWRFDGFWPMPADRFSHVIEYPCNEVPIDNNYEAYINFPINRDLIDAHFEASLDKFRQIESKSELKMCNFVLDNYRESDLFSDEWHPNSAFFLEVSKYILSQIGAEIDIRLQSNTGINALRHRLINNNVRRSLRNERVDRLLFYVDRWMTQDLYYFVSQNYLKDGPPFERHDQMIGYMDSLFTNSAELRDRSNHISFRPRLPAPGFLHRLRNTIGDSRFMQSTEIDLGDCYNVYAVDLKINKYDDIEFMLNNLAVSAESDILHTSIASLPGHTEYLNDSINYIFDRDVLVRYCSINYHKFSTKKHCHLPVFKYKAWSPRY